MIEIPKGKKMKRSTHIHLLILSMAMMAGIFVTPQAQADIEVAKVVFASGEVQVVDIDKRKRYVIKGDLIFAGETLITGKGRAQVKFTDDGRVSLKPKTIYSISDYYYDESDEEELKSFFELVVGTIRFVSGKIGKRNRAAFGIKTQTATIGIRGSSGQVTSCLNSGCPGQLDGTYLTTYQGVLIISSAGTELEVHPNQTAFCGADASGCSMLEQAVGGPIEPIDLNLGPSYRQGEQAIEDHGHVESTIPASPTPSYSTPTHTPPVIAPTAPAGGYNGGSQR